MLLAFAPSFEALFGIMNWSMELFAVEVGHIAGCDGVGFIDKRRDPEGHLSAVADCDIGWFRSRAEVGGIGQREYHALGLAMIGPDVGGSQDYVISETGSLVAPGANRTMRPSPGCS